MFRCASRLLSSRTARRATAAVATTALSSTSVSNASAVVRTSSSSQPTSMVAAVNPAVATSAFNALENQMIRSFRLDQVLSQVSTNDIVVARQDAARFSYIGFRDIAAVDVSRSLLLVPEHMRHFHTVCARENVPCDFFADVDLAFDVDGEAVLLELTNHLEDILKAIGFGDRTLIILQSEHSHKQSYHIHVRGATAAFSDFRAVRAVADKVNARMGRPTIDMGCYRYNGTLRAAFCSKVTGVNNIINTINNNNNALLTRNDSHLVPFAATTPQLATRLQNMFRMTAEELFQASLVNRQIPTEYFPNAEPLRLFTGIGKRSKLAKLLGTEGHVMTDRDGNVIDDNTAGGKFLREDLKWMRYKYAIKKLHQLPVAYAEDYNMWVNIGLALHSFGTDAHILEQWVRFSARCPDKFSRDVCQSKWLKFNAGSDVGNWRRGYNYLTATLWKQFGQDSASRRPTL